MKKDYHEDEVRTTWHLLHPCSFGIVIKEYNMASGITWFSTHLDLLWDETMLPDCGVWGNTVLAEINENVHSVTIHG